MMRKINSDDVLPILTGGALKSRRIQLPVITRTVVTCWGETTEYNALTHRPNPDQDAFWPITERAWYRLASKASIKSVNAAIWVLHRLSKLTERLPVNRVTIKMHHAVVDAGLWLMGFVN